MNISVSIPTCSLFEFRSMMSLRLRTPGHRDESLSLGDRVGLQSSGTPPKPQGLKPEKLEKTTKNPKLVGGFNHLEKYEFVNGKGYPFFEMENKIHIPNHQPENLNI